MAVREARSAHVQCTHYLRCGLGAASHGGTCRRYEERRRTLDTMLHPVNNRSRPRSAWLLQTTAGSLRVEGGVEWRVPGAGVACDRVWNAASGDSVALWLVLCTSRGVAPLRGLCGWDDVALWLLCACARARLCVDVTFRGSVRRRCGGRPGMG